MKSHKIIKDAVEDLGVKRVSSEMKLSTSMIYKWSQPPAEDEDCSGARNPLDRIYKLWEITGKNELIDWLCNKANGTYVPNPKCLESDVDSEYLHSTQKMISNFSELLAVISESIEDDGNIDQEEAQRIRLEWQELKQHAESFVVACEKGMFHK